MIAGAFFMPARHLMAPGYTQTTGLGHRMAFLVVWRGLNCGKPPKSASGELKWWFACIKCRQTAAWGGSCQGNSKLLCYGVREFVKDYGFGDEVLGAHAVGFEDVVVGVQGTQDDYFDIGIGGILTHLTDDFETVHDGHHDVQEYDVRFEDEDFPHGLKAVGSLMDRKVIPGKHLLYKELVQRDIVHHKDSVLGKIHNLSALLLQIAGKPHFGSDAGELLENVVE